MKIFSFIFTKIHRELQAIKKNREFRALLKTPRYKRITTDILGKPFIIADSASFLSMYQAIFEQQVYDFKTNNESPFIIDCGANIGLSSVFFKKKFPKAEIIAFEPDDQIFDILKLNMLSFGYLDVKLIKKALWSSETEISFCKEGADAGRIARHSDKKNLINAQSIRLSNYLSMPVDLLKMDIEGAETEVLRDCEDLLCNVENIFVEYHSFVNEPQTLHTLIAILSKTGFRLHIQSQNNARQPFCYRNIYMGIDLLLNIFGFRQ